MKRILGSLLLLYLVAFAQVEAELAKTDPYVKEPVLLHLRITPKDPGRIVWLRAHIIGKEVQSKLLRKTIQDGSYRFVYLLFFLSPGTHALEVRAQAKMASREAIEQDILGTGYEQTNPIEGEVRELARKRLQLQVRPVQKVDLYGDFHLSMQLGATRLKAFEPLSITLRLQGTGYPPEIKDPLRIPGVKLLADKPQKLVRYSEQGAKIDYIFRYAVVADHNFTIPAVRLRQFDFHSYKTLATKPVTITVEPVPKERLVDKSTSPKPIEPVWERFKVWLAALAIFGAGILSGYLLAFLWRDPLRERIQKMRSHKELLAFLITRFPNCFADIKERLERGESLSKIKRELRKRLGECDDTKAQK